MKCPKCLTELIEGLAGHKGTYSCPNLCVSGVRSPPAEPPSPSAEADEPPAAEAEEPEEPAEREPEVHEVEVNETGRLHANDKPPADGEAEAEELNEAELKGGQ